MLESLKISPDIDFELQQEESDIIKFDSSQESINADTIIVSDIHLGSEVSRAKDLIELIEKANYNRLILNGDVFDDMNFKRLNKFDWKLLSVFRKLSNPKRGKELVWVAGNHDGAAEILSHLLGINVVDEYIWEVEGKRHLAIHGHQFDKFLTENVLISDIASYIYLLMQKFDAKNQKLCRWVKRKSKNWLRLSSKIAADAIRYAKEKNVDFVYCGHTHLAGHYYSDGIHYYNSGCWTDIPSQLIAISGNNSVQIKETFIA